MNLLVFICLLVMLLIRAGVVAAQAPEPTLKLPEVVITGERLPRLDEAASQFLICAHRVFGGVLVAGTGFGAGVRRGRRGHRGGRCDAPSGV
jgi:hypothetical protein